MTTRFAVACALFLSSALAASALSAHQPEEIACGSSPFGASPQEVVCNGKTDRLAADTPRIVKMRQIGQSFLPAASDAIDLPEIGEARLDPANRAFIKIVSWIGVDEPEATSAELATR